MRKQVWWLLGLGFVLLALAILAACQIQTRPAEMPQVPTMTPFRVADQSSPRSAVASATLPPAQTPTTLPTSTPAPTFPPTPALTATPTESPMPFHLQAGTQRFIPAFIRVDQGCAWSGVAGQVFDSTGSGIAGVIIVITGAVDGRPVDQSGVTEAQSAYGPGGYEITLADHLPVSDEGLFIQLFDSQGSVLTKAEPFHMPNRCDRNLVLMNFQALYTLQKAFLPVIGRGE